MAPILTYRPGDSILYDTPIEHINLDDYIKKCLRKNSGKNFSINSIACFNNKIIF